MTYDAEDDDDEGNVENERQHDDAQYDVVAHKLH